MTQRQIDYKRNRLQGMNKTQAALEAGYSFNYATHRSKMLENVVESRMKDVFEHLGFSDYKIAQKYVQKIDSKNERIALKALDSIAEIVGMKKQGNVDVNVNTKIVTMSHIVLEDDQGNKKELRYNIGENART